MKKKSTILLLTIFLFLNLAFKGFSQKTIIKSTDEWEYYDKGYLDNDWFLKTNLYKWKKGITPIGYGDKTIVTEISFGDNEEDKHLLKYFKKEINITKKDFLGFEFKIQRDDGAVVYVNGKELFRSNMQSFDIHNKSTAKGTVEKVEEDLFFTYVFENSIFNEGKNTIAVSIHQAYPESSDCIFSLEIIGHETFEILDELVRKKNNLNQKLEDKLVDLSNKFEVDKLKNRNEALSDTNYNLKALLLVLFVLLVIIFVGIYLLIENYRKKANDSLEELLLYKKQILDKEKEMLLLSTKILNNKQYFKELKADLRGLKTEDTNTLKMILSEINEAIEKEDEWVSLKKHFDAVFEGFYDQLIKLHPELSETDLRHCLFIKLHLQTKEIAKILLVDPRSVQTTRYRIKKKMNLEENIDLREYLLNI